MSNAARQARMESAASGAYKYMSQDGFDAISDRLGMDRIKWPEPLDVAVLHPAMMDSRIAFARKLMGEDRWNALNAEWEA